MGHFISVKAKTELFSCLECFLNSVDSGKKGFIASTAYDERGVWWASPNHGSLLPIAGPHGTHSPRCSASGNCVMAP